MDVVKLTCDPFNLLIVGVGGQGNILASKLLGLALMRKGLTVTIGETFGGTQKGGSVSSHMRISTSSTWAPLMPSGSAHVVLGFEPIETLRILEQYGNSQVKVICNPWSIPPLSVLSGEEHYPEISNAKKWIEDLSAECWFLDATVEAMKLGKAVYTNIITLGALTGLNVLPLGRKDFEMVFKETWQQEQVEANLKAFDLGHSLISNGKVY